jgi:tetratricopeptide (TPR) repeat protein
VYNRAIHINPGYAAAFTNRGIAYARKGEQGKAIADYTEAIQLKPDNAIAFHNRANAYMAQRELDKAKVDEDKAISLCPGLDVLKETPIVAYNIGNVLTGNWSNDKEIEKLTAAILLQPNNATLFNNRAVKYAMYGEYDRAVTDWTEAIRLSPEDIFYLEARGDIYAKKGDYDKAIADYTELTRLNPDYPDPLRSGEQPTKPWDNTTRPQRIGMKWPGWSKKINQDRLGPSVNLALLIAEAGIRRYLSRDTDKIISETGKHPKKLAAAFLKKSLSSFLAGDEQEGENFLAKALNIYSGMNQAEAGRLKSTFLADFIDSTSDVLNVFDIQIAGWTELLGPVHTTWNQ